MHRAINQTLYSVTWVLYKVNLRRWWFHHQSWVMKFLTYRTKHIQTYKKNFHNNRRFREEGFLGQNGYFYLTFFKVKSTFVIECHGIESRMYVNTRSEKHIGRLVLCVGRQAAYYIFASCSIYTPQYRAHTLAANPFHLRVTSVAAYHIWDTSFILKIQYKHSNSKSEKRRVGWRRIQIVHLLKCAQ